MHLFEGYIHYLETVPNLQVMLVEDDRLFSPNSCWHIKNNRHIMIHSWNTDEPMMVYSDQLMLINEFQQQFDRLWKHTDAEYGKDRTLDIMRELRDRCASLIC